MLVKDVMTQDPITVVPSVGIKAAMTKLAFAGITKESEVDNLWAFISQFDKDGKIKSK